ncbi:MAG: CRISPR-associated helicase Cas3' [Alphaproteobacteria bacterium]|nr:MAG: CRISPR-associated helicase Cas3' [Alphaproteobacteria bacterium]
MARRAVEAAGLLTPPVTDATLFDFDFRPLQRAAAQTPLTDGPMLAVLEDETGSGKTEAALILAQRMMRAGKGQGLYFALPTMATADAMFARVAEVLLRLYAGPPSLVLAHGRATLDARFRDIAQARALNPDEPGPTEWLLDNRRRALLADVGVGTIDQALLAILRVRHAPLRQFGLSRKILIVDEVHEMGDPYMGRLLEALLHAHAALGGSAILLSATLPLRLRQKLVEAFETGARREPPRTTGSRAYPAMTVPHVDAPAVIARPSPRGPVAVRRLPALDAAFDSLVEAAGKGAACVLIRNAVDEALAARDALAARGAAVDLLHARFALRDRKRHEAGILARYGKARDPRPGRILVATQVVEASLDLDFDVMVSDLAPMASLIQRAGRLWRHMDHRPRTERPVPQPVLQVIAPDPAQAEGADWARVELGQGAFVYGIADLWRTARVLFEVGEIAAPEGLRDLVERAEDQALALPEALEAAAIELEGRRLAERAQAGHNVIAWEQGYRCGASGADDDVYPTRLGRPQLTLVLARREGGTLVPWTGGAWAVENCQLSEVQASKARLEKLALPDQEAPEIAEIRATLPGWLAATRVFCPVGENGAIAPGLAYDSERGLILGRTDA